MWLYVFNKLRPEQKDRHDFEDDILNAAFENKKQKRNQKKKNQQQQKQTNKK